MIFLTCSSKRDTLFADLLNRWCWFEMFKTAKRTRKTMHFISELMKRIIISNWNGNKCITQINGEWTKDCDNSLILRIVLHVPSVRNVNFIWKKKQFLETIRRNSFALSHSQRSFFWIKYPFFLSKRWNGVCDGSSMQTRSIQSDWVLIDQSVKICE